MLCVVFVLLGLENGFSQPIGNKLIDSLRTRLEATPFDTNRVQILGKLVNQYSLLGSELAMQYGTEGLTLSDSLEYPAGIGLLKIGIGRYLWKKGNYEEALKYHQEALAIYEQLNDKGKIALLQILICQDYADKGDYPDGLKHCITSLDYYSAYDSSSENVSALYTIISWIYSTMGMPAEATQYDYAALRRYESMGDSIGQAVCLGNIGRSLAGQGKYAQALEIQTQCLPILEKFEDYVNLAATHIEIGSLYSNLDNDSLMRFHHHRAIEIGTQFEDHKLIASAYRSMGRIYVTNGNATEALKYLHQAERECTNGNNDVILASLYSDIGGCYTNLGNYTEAQKYFKLANTLVADMESVSDRNHYYHGLVKLDSATGQWQNAFSNYRLYIQTRDSIYNDDNTKRIVQSQMQYDFDKKQAEAKAEQDKKDAITRAELQRQKLIRNGFVGGFSVVVLFAGIFFSQRNKIRKGKKLSDELLLNILPAEVAEELKAKGAADAKLIDEVTVMFSDFIGFTGISEILSPKDLVAEINTCFSAYDVIMQKHGIEKIKTVGDAYLAAGGIPIPDARHAVSVIHAALEMQEFMRSYRIQRESEGKHFFQARLGVHTGPVVAGIVGIKKFAYDIWGDTVNTAQRMESACDAGRVNISESTYALVKEHFRCTYRGKIAVKGKGEVDMYFVEGPI